MANIPIYMEGQDGVLYQDELNQGLQESLSNNGWTVPILTTSEITDASSKMPNGTLWYDSNTNELKVLKNGSVVVIQTT